MGIALRFHRFTVAFCGGCSRKAPRLRFAEFVQPSIDTELALVAVVTNDTHWRTLHGRRPASLSWFEQRPEDAMTYAVVAAF
jgi:hypothetical protein